MEKTFTPEDAQVDFVITKATVDPATGQKRWAATVSKFEVDRQDDEVTREFYEYAANKVIEGEYPVPALVVSHFDDYRSEAKHDPTPEVFIAGITSDVYIDGNQPKAKGFFVDTPLGNATFDAVRSDMKNNIPHEARARISMAFRPEPGGVQKSDSGVNRFVKGSIRHFAVTRVPIVESTDIEAGGMELKSDMAKTKRDDAATIIGDELADELQSAYGNIVKSKSESDLRLKAGGSFDMSECLSIKIGEGTPKKQALAICLKMSRKDGKEMPTMSDHQKADIIEKLGKRRNPYRTRDGRFSSQQNDGKPGILDFLRRNEDRRLGGGRGGIEPRKPSGGGGGAGAGGDTTGGRRGLSSVGVASAAEPQESTSSVSFGGPESNTRLRKLLSESIRDSRTGKWQHRDGTPLTAQETHDLELAQAQNAKRDRIAGAESETTQGLCVQRWLDNGLDAANAQRICASLSVDKMELTEKRHSMDVPFDECVEIYLKDPHNMSHPEAVKACKDGNSEKADLSAPLAECLKSRMDEGIDNIAALKACLTDEALTARVKAGHEDIDWDGILYAIITDDNMEVVIEKGEDMPLENEVSRAEGEVAPTDVQAIFGALNTLNERLDSYDKSDATEEAVGESEEATGESEGAIDGQDVNDSEVEESVSVEQGVKSHFDEFMLVLGNDGLDRTEKAALTNHLMEEIASFASEQINATDASSDDLADMLKAALEEVMGPQATEVAMLVERVNELESDNAALRSKADAPTPFPKQLNYADSPVQKAEVKGDTGGALSAAQIAELSVQHSGPRY